MCTTCGCGDGTSARVTTLSGGRAAFSPDDPGSSVHGQGGAGVHTEGAHVHDHGHDHVHHDDQAHDRVDDHERGHDHDEGAPSHRQDGPGRVHTTTIDIEQQVLAKNDVLAASNRAWLAERGIGALNLMSSPGSGKTSLLVRTVRDVGARRPVAVIEGDQETLLDAERVRATGCAVVQINTGAGCHLDADMLRRGLEALQPAEN
jgi:hydrogenase nickel incorporation protein HypB